MKINAAVFKELKALADEGMHSIDDAAIAFDAGVLRPVSDKVSRAQWLTDIAPGGGKMPLPVASYRYTGGMTHPARRGSREAPELPVILGREIYSGSFSTGGPTATSIFTDATALNDDFKRFVEQVEDVLPNDIADNFTPSSFIGRHRAFGAIVTPDGESANSVVRGVFELNLVGKHGIMPLYLNGPVDATRGLWRYKPGGTAQVTRAHPSLIAIGSTRQVSAGLPFENRLVTWAEKAHE